MNANSKRRIKLHPVVTFCKQEVDDDIKGNLTCDTSTLVALTACAKCSLHVMAWRSLRHTTCMAITEMHNLHQLQLPLPCAGVVPIVHDSGGPKADIVKHERMQQGWQPTGYLCTSEEQYADAITEVLCMDQQDRLKIAAAARQ